MSARRSRYFHFYNFIIDGVRVTDINTYTYGGSYGRSSAIEISEGPEGNYYRPHDVPHGQMRNVVYYSTYEKRYRRCNVYTPPDKITGSYPDEMIECIIPAFELGRAKNLFHRDVCYHRGRYDRRALIA